MAYGFVHTTNVLGAKPVSFQSDVDIENGFFISKGALVDGETQIYKALQPDASTIADRAYIAANPAWSYDDSRKTNQNEENFINPKNRAFRAYDLTPGNKITVPDYILTGDAAINSYVAPAAGTYKGAITTAKPSAGFIGQITAVTEAGYFYTVGVGVPGTTADGESLGVGQDGRVKMVTIEVLKNG